MINHVTVKDIAEKWQLENLTPEVDISTIEIHHAEVNRPALQMAGSFEHFDSERIQMVGNVEFMYARQLPAEVTLARCRQLFSYHIPCLIYCRNLRPSERLLEGARKEKVPLSLS